MGHVSCSCFFADAGVVSSGLYSHGLANGVLLQFVWKIFFGQNLTDFVCFFLTRQRPKNRLRKRKWRTTTTTSWFNPLLGEGGRRRRMGGGGTQPAEGCVGRLVQFSLPRRAHALLYFRILLYKSHRLREDNLFVAVPVQRFYTAALLVVFAPPFFWRDELTRWCSHHRSCRRECDSYIYPTFLFLLRIARPCFCLPPDMTKRYVSSFFF